MPADEAEAVQGPYAAQLRLVGNAMPLLLGWAILGGVYEAAYGTPAPKPAFLAERPAQNGRHNTAAYVSYSVPAHTATCGRLSAEHLTQRLVQDHGPGSACGALKCHAWYLLFCLKADKLSSCMQSTFLSVRRK